MTVWAVLGIAAGVLSLIDPVPYVRDILRGTTRPHRGTWGIWSLLGVIAFVAAIAEDGRWSLVLLGIQALSMLLTARGTGGFSTPEVVMLGLGGIGTVGWVLSSEPLVAIVFVILANVAGVLLMLPKTWRDPHSETASCFAISCAAGVLGTASVGVLDPGLLLYPAAIAVLDGSVAALIVLRARRVPRSVPVPVLTVPARDCARGVV
jgi:hypothetical protein